MELVTQAEGLYKDRKFKELVFLLEDGLLKQNANPILYSYKARALDKIGETELCLLYADISIAMDPGLPYGFLARGNSWYDKKEIEKAIKDYTSAIQLDSNISTAFYNRGNAWLTLKNYENAIADYSTAIGLGHNFAHYNRAFVYNILGNYENAIADYDSFLNIEILLQDNTYLKIASNEIEKINIKTGSVWFVQFDALLKKIKEFLLFEQSTLTHYTSLSTTNTLLLEQSPFRVSEGSYLNDTSEGNALFKYLFSNGDNLNLVEGRFMEKPFIASFVSQQNFDDLTLWRMYGKEKQADAKGCSLTLNKWKFKRYLETAIFPFYAHSVDFPETEGNFTFYHVAYWNGKQFVVPGKDASKNKQLNELLKMLKNNLRDLENKYDQLIQKSLSEIKYLFKNAIYQHESEIRLVIEGTGFKKKIIKDISPPRVCIELIPLGNFLTKIVIGPNVERPEEWAAAFNYHLKQNLDVYTSNKNLTEEIEILISQLPYK